LFIVSAKRNENPNPMQRSNSDKLSNQQVARIEERRRELGLPPVALREKFDAALREMGQKLGDAALKARFNRIFNRRMRRAISEESKLALARALGWSWPQFEQAIHNVVESQPRRTKKQERGMSDAIKKSSPRQIALAALVQIETHQIGRGVDLGKDNLSRVYTATYKMFGRLRELMGELPAAEFNRDGVAARIYESLNNILNKTLRPHLTLWPERYEEWRTTSLGKSGSRKLSAQQLQQRFPQRKTLARDLKKIAKRLQSDATALRSLICE
jgi:hypothetical protein